VTLLCGNLLEMELPASPGVDSVVGLKEFFLRTYLIYLRIRYWQEAFRVLLLLLLFCSAGDPRTGPFAC
jgi:hypothetical protein